MLTLQGSPHAPMTRNDPNAVIAALSRDRVRLELGTFDLCCLAGLLLRADRDALASFPEELVVDLFEQVCDAVEPGADNPRKRATHAIQRLRDQRMLARVDGAGLVRSGEYALTRLAVAVVEFFLADEALTRESLTLLTRTLLSQLAEIKGAAARAGDPATWSAQVVAPLRVTVGDLVSGIERRQRGLDTAQEQVKETVAGLLQADWFGAVDEAQEVLDTTASTLDELNQILLRDTHQFQALLHEILDLAESSGAQEAREAAQRVVEQVDRIAFWGKSRQAAWSEYYQFVHRYLRDVVRLDPDRALSQRLRDQLSGWASRPFYLARASTPRLPTLRDVAPRVDRPPVARERTERERPPDTVCADDEGPDLESLVLAALDDGATSLSAITDHVLRSLPSEAHFGAAGQVAAIAARLARVRSDRERAWVPVVDRFEIEQWQLTGASE